MRNTRLELDCLMHMSKISNKTNRDPETSLKVLKDTFEVKKNFHFSNFLDS